MNLKNNPELIPVIEWWEKDGKQLVIYLAIAAIAVGGWYGWKNHQRAAKIAASESLVNSYTVEEIEDAVAKFSGSQTEGALKLRLAKSYFDAARYDEALEQYEAMIGKAPDGFADVPFVGKAQSLEALGRFADAVKAFDQFVEENPKSYLKLTAQLGAARSLAESGDKKAALARIETLKAANKDADVATARIEATESLINRLGKPAAKPAAKPVVKPVAPVAKPAAAKPAAKPVAPAAKPAAPATK